MHQVLRSPGDGRDARKTIMLISLLTSVIMLSGKITAYVLTNSAAILSDAAESVVHGAATGLAAFSLWYASRPPDTKHTYGHGRIAYFSAGFEGALVMAASVTVVYNAIASFVYGPQLKPLGLGMTIAGSLAVINLVLGTTLVAVGKKYNSLIVTANGKHVLSDMWTTVAALAGLGLVIVTGVELLDPITALLIGVYIMVTGFSLVRQSIAGLMDEVDPESSQRLVDGLREAVSDGTISDFHQVRCRRTNDELWVDVHLLVPGELTTVDAHARASRVEGLLRALFPHDHVRITSHVEPAEHEEAHPGGHGGPADPLKQQAEREPPSPQEDG